MSRQLKFRAYHKELGRMLHFEGVGYCDEYNDLTFGLRDSDRDPKGGTYSNLCTDIDEMSEVMQFTGLRDKNGKEIYEGDIARHRKAGDFDGKDLIVGEVVIESNRGVVIGNWPASFDIEVIGNIHENPELLDPSLAAREKRGTE